MNETIAQAAVEQFVAIVKNGSSYNEAWHVLVQSNPILRQELVKHHNYFTGTLKDRCMLAAA